MLRRILIGIYQKTIDVTCSIHIDFRSFPSTDDCVDNRTEFYDISLCRNQNCLCAFFRISLFHRTRNRSSASLSRQKQPVSDSSEKVLLSPRATTSVDEVQRYQRGDPGGDTMVSPPKSPPTMIDKWLATAVFLKTRSVGRPARQYGYFTPLDRHGQSSLRRRAHRRFRRAAPGRRRSHIVGRNARTITGIRR